MAEKIICMVIVLIGALPMVIIGIFQCRSKEPVGFWSGKKPPEKDRITDVKAYNRKHGIMWIVYGIGFFLCFVLAVFLGEELALAAVALGTVECIGGIFVMIAYHNKLNRRYFRK
ncbi:MAG: hypothetical protein HFH36_12155 [Lachnospiraceae bacterium]|nr:hypothetical protein [Lachnospiraceae bacterium]